MIPKKIRFIILNEETNYNRSFILKKPFFIFLLIKIIMIFSFSFWGLYRFIKPHENEKIINNNINLRNNTLDLLAKLLEENKIDTTLLKNFSINEDLNSLMPDLMPVQGIVTKGIRGEDKNHFGIDIATKLNEKIQASQDGIVVFAGNYNDYGNTIIISHPNNYFTLYSHLKKINVRQRQNVKRGDFIGTIGETGQSDGPHLHFEIWKNNIIIDPRDIIKEYKEKDVSVK